MEVSLIEALNSKNREYGYNKTNGGEATKGYKFTKEQKEKMSKVLKEKYSNEYLGEPIYQFDLDKKFIRKYKSIQEVHDLLGLNENSIRNASNNGKSGQITGCGYIWRREEDIEVLKDGTTIPLNVKPFINRKIYQFDTNGTFIEVYDTINDINCKNKNKIYACVNKRNVTSMGYIWRYSEDVEFDNSIPKIKGGVPNVRKKKRKLDSNKEQYKEQRKEIYQFDLGGNFIMKYKSLNEASRCNNNIDPSTVSKCARGKFKKSYGYKWKYEDGVVINKDGTINIKEEDSI